MVGAMEKVGRELLETGVRGGRSRWGGGSGGRRTPDTAVGETAALPGERIHDTPGPGTTLRGVSTQPGAAGEKEEKKTLTQRPFEQHCAPGLHYTESAPSHLPNSPPQRSTHTSARAALAPNLALAPAGAAVVRAEIDTRPARAAPQARVTAAGTAVALRGGADLARKQCGELGSGVEVEVGL